jgi:Zn-dependent protease with chaperone function
MTRRRRTHSSCQVSSRHVSNLTSGGKTFVFTGLLPVCANDDGLASVLGHEVAHQGKARDQLLLTGTVARHSAERMSSMKVSASLEPC